MSIAGTTARTAGDDECIGVVIYVLSCLADFDVVVVMGGLWAGVDDYRTCWGVVVVVEVLDDFGVGNNFLDDWGGWGWWWRSGLLDDNGCWWRWGGDGDDFLGFVLFVDDCLAVGGMGTVVVRGHVVVAFA